MLHQIKAQQFYTDLDLYQQCYVLQKIEEFKDFSRHFSDFPVLFKAYLISRTFLDSPLNSSTFQVCANPEFTWNIKPYWLVHLRKYFERKIVIFFLPINLYICFENPPHTHWHGSFEENPQQMYWLRNKKNNLSHDTRFPTMWYVWPAKPQISLPICAVWSEPLLVTWIFYKC